MGRFRLGQVRSQGDSPLAMSPVGLGSGGHGALADRVPAHPDAGHEAAETITSTRSGPGRFGNARYLRAVEAHPQLGGRGQGAR